MLTLLQYPPVENFLSLCRYIKAFADIFNCFQLLLKCKTASTLKRHYSTMESFITGGSSNHTAFLKDKTTTAFSSCTSQSRISPSADIRYAEFPSFSMLPLESSGKHHFQQEIGEWNSLTY